MSTKYLGNNFDIHTGGIEHIAVHHTNEIAQGFAAFGKQTANYWLHNGWLMGKGGEKMSKSLGNFVTAQELVEKGYDPIAMRYLILTSHYKKGLNFSYESLESAQNALVNLRSQISQLRQGFVGQANRTVLSEEKNNKIDEYLEKFIAALSDDINVPQALAVMWEMLKSNIPSGDKYDLAMSFDEVLGLNLKSQTANIKQIPKEIQILISKREQLRKEKKFEEADEIRDEIEKSGYKVKDTSL
jgi:cysteinyl-tRNA synthetase